MTLIGRENDVSGNGVTLDYDMLLRVLRLASNDTREDLRIMATNLDWQSRPSRSDARRMQRKALNLAEITETLWVLQSMEPDENGRWPIERWLGFQWTRREEMPEEGKATFLNDLEKQLIEAGEVFEEKILYASPPCEPVSTSALSDIEALGFAVVNDFSKESTTETTGRKGGSAVKHCSTCGEEGHNMRTCTATMQEHANNGFSAWNEYQTNSENHIFWKSGPRKGKMNQKAMAKAYRKQSEDETITCKECGTDETSIDKRTNRPLWRHKKASFGPLCNACGSRRYRNQS